MLNVECSPKMFPKSIKWRLQLWYGLILVVVLAGLGITALQLEHWRQMFWLSTNLELRFAEVVGALHPHPTEGPREHRPDEPPPDRPPPDQFPDDRPPEQNPRPPHEFHLPPEFSTLFDPSDPHHFYFIVYRNDERSDEIFAQSTNAKMFKRLHTIENNRRLPSGEFVSVGCSDQPELQELKSTAWKLAVAGVVILFFGLAGGWWIVSRSLRPVVEISAAAAKISAGDLSQRINVAEAESELGQLAAVLNSTFARLEAAFAQQKQFAADAAHELRTPVSILLTQAQTALNRERTAPEYRETVEACQRAAQRMRKLIESLLALARFDAGQEVLERLRFDFSKTIAECIELVKPMTAERRVKIISDLPPTEITGDAGRLAQVIANLLTNAIQYNRPDGEVRMKLESRNGLAILTVADTGQGITPADLPLVFGRFFRADQSRTGAGNTGLGLAISKAIVEAHGGAIEVASAENVGTTFIVRLPV
jgi:two-component system OmpR family sensor kinase